MPESPERVAFERRFRRAGLPLFIEGYTATEDVFNRAIPLLGLVFIAEVLGAVNLQWSVAANLAAVAGALLVLLLGVGFLNRMQGRRFASIPRRLGRIELAAFVIVPALLPELFNGQQTSSVVTAVGNLTLLGVIYVVVGYGLIPIVRGSGGRLGEELSDALSLLVRAIPLLLVTSLLLFFTTELWQVFSEMPPGFYGVLIGMLAVLGSTFVIARMPREIDRLERDADAEGPSLTRRQRINVGLVLFVSQGLQVLVVSIAASAFFVGLGLLAIDDAVLKAWIGSTGHGVGIEFAVGGRNVRMTEELLKVAGGLGAFSGFYYAITVLTDATYREEFLQDITDDMRAIFRERVQYLALIGRSPSSPS